MNCKYTTEELFYLVNHQLCNFWPDGEVSDRGFSSIEKAADRIEENFIHRKGQIFQSGTEANFDITHSVQYGIFLYTYANQLYREGLEDEAGRGYYLNKIMNSVDWFYAVSLPEIFSAEHPLGSVVGKAAMDNYLFLYQGTTIGGNRKNGILAYPTIGHHVLMYANSKILGNAHIGNNVILAANTMIIDEDVPNDSLVFGQSPNLIIKKKTEDEIRGKMNHIWTE